MAELLFRERSQTARPAWEVRSAGTRAADGEPLHARTVRALKERGVSDPEWRSHALTAAEVERADLILTAEEEHRAVVARVAPAALSRTWTLLHFAYLIDESSSEREADLGCPDELLSCARHSQSRTQPLSPEEMNLADPITGSMRRFRRCADTIETALTHIFG